MRGARAATYGHPAVNLTQAAVSWGAYGFRVQEPEGDLRWPTAHDVICALVLVKVMRASRGYHRDTAVDVAGYAGLDEVVSDPDAGKRFGEELP